MTTINLSNWNFDLTVLAKSEAKCECPGFTKCIHKGLCGKNEILLPASVPIASSEIEEQRYQLMWLCSMCAVTSGIALVRFPEKQNQYVRGEDLIAHLRSKEKREKQ